MAVNSLSKLNFNCTIQELKLSRHTRLLSTSAHFNCTIQELKHVGVIVSDDKILISIAPYRN